MAQFVFSFEKLDVYKEVRSLTKQIYLLTSIFPVEEKFGIVSQIRRATVSVCLNIAEGSSRFSSKEQARFYEIAYGSLMEVVACLHLSQDLGYTKENIDKLLTEINNISYKINALRKKAEHKFK